MEYQDLKSGIRSHLNDAAEDFFMVGYFLRQISENALFTEDGYKSIWEFAKGEYGLSTSSASRFMAINARFSIDGGEHMAEKYIGMGVSRLQEMLGLPDEELEKVTQETTVREIRAMKKKQEAPHSFYGLPKTEYPEGSLLTIPGCGDGKYSCFSCCHECELRQDDRHCRTAPCGDPFPCVQMGREKRLNIRSGIFSEKCQFLHPELAPVRKGDQEPEPCCLTCEHKTCFSRCDVAKKKDADGKMQAQEELQKQQRGAEAERPEPSGRDIKAFYDWCRFETTDTITAAALKDRYKNSGGGGGRGAALQNYAGSAKGMRINYKRELTWAQLAKQLTEIHEAEKEKADQKLKEDGRLLEFYKEIYPSTRQIISQRDKAAITKELKTIYGSTYENGKGWMCYPDKIVFKDSPDTEQIQFTWGRFTTKLVELLDRFPAAERAALAGEKPEHKEPEIIDADFYEVQDGGEPEPAAQEPEAEAEPDPEEYGRLEVCLLLDKYRKDIKAYKEAECPPQIIQSQKILIDALTLLLKQIDSESGGNGAEKEDEP